MFKYTQNTIFIRANVSESKRVTKKRQNSTLSEVLPNSKCDYFYEMGKKCHRFIVISHNKNSLQLLCEETRSLIDLALLITPSYYL